MRLNPDLFQLWWPTESEDPEYVGCYHDHKEDRVLAHSITVPGMTAAICREYCSDKDALFNATQVGLRACRNAPWQDSGFAFVPDRDSVGSGVGDT